MTSPRVKVTIDNKRLFRRLNKDAKLLALAGGNAVENLTNAGKFHAKQIAPHFTGRTAKMIRKRVTMTNQGKKGLIIAPNPTGPGEPRNGRKPRDKAFNLVRYMHTREGRRHFKSRSDFMFRTRDWLNTIKKRVATGEFNKIKL